VEREERAPREDIMDLSSCLPQSHRTEAPRTEALRLLLHAMKSAPDTEARAEREDTTEARDPREDTTEDVLSSATQSHPNLSTEVNLATEVPATVILDTELPSTEVPATLTLDTELPSTVILLDTDTLSTEMNLDTVATLPLTATVTTAAQNHPLSLNATKSAPDTEARAEREDTTEARDPREDTTDVKPSAAHPSSIRFFKD